MGENGKIIEIATTAGGSAFSEDYQLARQLALAGSADEATRIYWQVLATIESPARRAIVYNDLATLAAAYGDEVKARELLWEALALDPQCRAARDNWIALGLETPIALDGRNDRPGNSAVKVAIVSGMFNWPSGGGGNVHTVQLTTALRQSNLQVHHFYLKYEPWLIGDVVGNPAGSQAISFTESNWSLTEIQARVSAAVKECDPDFVLVTDSWSLKPWLAEAVDDYPYFLRLDAAECLCPLNNLRVIPHPNRYLQSCSKHRLATPESCLRCVQERGQYAAGRHKWEREFSRFDSPEYHELLLRSLARAEAVLVHNPLIAAVLEPYATKVCVVPIGVDRRTFGEVPKALRESNNGITRILFGGRTTDPIKGFEVLRAAGEDLWQQRQDFRILATGKPSGIELPFIEWKGWQSHDDMVALLASADIVAAPAVVNEPFGLTVVEAMAAARPVVASRVGGQQFTVVDGLTGLLCEPDDPIDLAEKLATLLDSVELRIALGAAARRRFLSEYCWEVVIDRYYRPLFRLRSQTSCAVAVQ